MSIARKKLVPEIPKDRCFEVSTSEEADVIIRLLNYILSNTTHQAISASEINVMKRIAIIRTQELSLDLINPEILECQGNIVAFNEPCYSSDSYLNCMRYEQVVIQTGFDKKKITLRGKSAALIQHVVDHMNGINFQNKAIRVALIREGGKIGGKDYCPCGSKKRFSACCQTT